MTLTAYATSTDLASWLGTAAPSNAASLLRSATVLVAVATGRSPYDTPSGDDAEPLRDATTAQAAAWIAAGITPAAGGLDSAPVKESKLGPGDITYDTAGQADARAKAAAELGSEARAILLAAGLLLVDLPVWPAADDQLLDYGLSGTWPTVIDRT